MFLIDYAVRLLLSEHRWNFVRANWIDLIILAVPMLRPVRAVRGVLALNLLARRSHFVRGKAVTYVGAAVAVVVFIAGLAVLDAERQSPVANIQTFGDALWWGTTTVTTVGYGDRFPTTGEGRAVGVALMLTGIALVGVVTAALASWFVERTSEAATAAEEANEAEVADVAADLRALREEVRFLRNSET